MRINSTSIQLKHDKIWSIKVNPAMLANNNNLILNNSLIPLNANVNINYWYNNRLY